MKCRAIRPTYSANWPSLGRSRPPTPDADAQAGQPKKTNSTFRPRARQASTACSMVWR
ncbi:MAG: DUF3470 domain-containing protein [Planctomycetia bacterium]|nr:DUF3470 domain-containing protein [Planctomycetia bacterium]NDH93040.1 DUF3470 domain-containing protein [Planctomycetia bacterium]